MEKVGMLPYRVRGYCATCRKEFGPAKEGSLGRRIKCEDGHLAQVISADDSAEWWLRKEMWLLNWQNRYSPFARLRIVQKCLSRQFRETGPSKPLQAGSFLVITFGLIITA